MAEKKWPDAPGLSPGYRSLPAPCSLARMEISGGQARLHFFGAAPEPDAPPPAPPSLHRHAHYELVYVCAGELTQHLENGTFKYRRGEACFLNRDTAHYEGLETDCTLIFLNLAPPFAAALFGDTGILPGRAQHASPEICRFLTEDRGPGGEYLDFFGTLALQRADTPPPAQEIFGEIEAALTQKAPGFAFQVQAALLRLFAELENAAHYHLSRMRVDARAQDFILARLLRYMEERQGQVGRREAAELLHYDGNYINSIVRRQTGLTIGQLGRRFRLEAAQRLLRETDLPVAAIIRALGFQNRTHFYRLFAQHTGLTPLEYRVQARGQK